MFCNSWLSPGSIAYRESHEWQQQRREAWHTQRVFNGIWMPHAWGQHTGQGGVGGGPSVVSPSQTRCWHGTTAASTRRLRSKRGDAEFEYWSPPYSFSSLEGCSRRSRPWDGLVNNLSKSNMTAPYDNPTASSSTWHQAPWTAASHTRRSPYRGVLQGLTTGAVGEKISRDKVGVKVVRSSWEIGWPAFLLLPLDGSGGDARGNTELKLGFPREALRRGCRFGRG